MNQGSISSKVQDSWGLSGVTAFIFRQSRHVWALSHGPFGRSTIVMLLGVRGNRGHSN